jgi:hypothetical protein
VLRPTLEQDIVGPPDGIGIDAAALEPAVLIGDGEAGGDPVPFLEMGGAAEPSAGHGGLAARQIN